jgi:radical SAM superfamily enzyme YgiQ (UPF0313 family)
VHYEGPIYRPPSEADSLLVQATIGCPHNRCTFCMVYKKAPPYRVRPVADICRDLREAAQTCGPAVTTLFFPAGNTIAMKTADLSEICRFARRVLPALERITVYGSFQYIHRKGPEALKRLAAAGLTRIHVGLESGDDVVLDRIGKGTRSGQQIEAGRWVMDAGIELSLYVMLGIGGRERTGTHAAETARVLNAVAPDFIRLRTFLPKIDTPLLADIAAGRFQMLGPHAVLRETRQIIEALAVPSRLTSDHYTNYINLEGRIPDERARLLALIESALGRDERTFRPVTIGTQ